MDTVNLIEINWMSIILSLGIFCGIIAAIGLFIKKQRKKYLTRKK